MPKKLENCVKDVKKQGKSEDSAYAICSKSTGYKVGKGSTKHNKKWIKESLYGKYIKENENNETQIDEISKYEEMERQMELGEDNVNESRISTKDFSYKNKNKNRSFFMNVIRQGIIHQNWKSNDVLKFIKIRQENAKNYPEKYQGVYVPNETETENLIDYLRYKRILREGQDTFAITLKKDDTVKVGKYRNKPAKIKEFQRDENGQPEMKTNKGTRKVFGMKVDKFNKKKDDKKEDNVKESKLYEDYNEFHPDYDELENFKQQLEQIEIELDELSKEIDDTGWFPVQQGIDMPDNVRQLLDKEKEVQNKHSELEDKITEIDNYEPPSQEDNEWWYKYGSEDKI